MRQVMGSIPTLEIEIYLSGVEATRGIQFRHYSEENRDRSPSILTLGTFCLPCYGRDTAWCQKKIIYLNKYIYIYNII